MCGILLLVKKLQLIFITLFALVFINTKTANAKLITVDPQGEVVWSVLSEEDESSLDVPDHSYLEIKEVAEESTTKDSTVNLSKKDDKLSLVVTSGNKTREMDVSNWKEDLIEVEERAETQKMTIGIDGDKFALKHKSVTALTDFPLSVDTKSAKISIETPSGDKYISILPYQAVQTLLRSKLINFVTGNKIAIIDRNNNLEYEITGDKTFNLLGIYIYSVPVKSYISVATGEIADVEAPVWYKAVSTLLI